MKWLTAIPQLLSGGWGIWIRLGLVAIALTAAAGWGYVKGVEHGADERARVQIQLERCQDGQAELESSIAHQNGALEALKADAARKAVEAAGALRAAGAARTAAQAEAQRLRAQRARPREEQGACPAGAALEQVRRELQ